MNLFSRKKLPQSTDNDNVTKKETDEEKVVEEQCRPFDEDIYEHFLQETSLYDERQCCI